MGLRPRERFARAWSSANTCDLIVQKPMVYYTGKLVENAKPANSLQTAILEKLKNKTISLLSPKELVFTFYY